MSGSGKGPLRVAIEDFIQTFKFGDILFGGLKKRLENWELQIWAVLAPWLDEQQLRTLIIPNVPGGAGSTSITDHAVKMLDLLGLYVMAVIGTAASFMGPVRTLMLYKANKVYYTYRMDPGTAIAAAWRDTAYSALMTSDLSDRGVNTDRAKLLTELARPHLSERDMGELFRREEIDGAEFVLELQARGYLQSDIDKFKRILSTHPGAGDLEAFATRQAYDDSVAGYFGLDDEMPDAYVKEMSHLGYEAESIRHYWRSHWTLPGLSQGFDMLHRLRPGRSDFPFVEADLDQLMKNQGVPVAFRKRLLELSYSPLPRLVVNALYGAGKMTEQEVFDNYLDMGFNEKIAHWLTAYTVDVKNGPKKDLTKSTIVTSYSDGLIDRDKAVSMLKDIELDDDDITFILAQADYMLNKQKIDDTLSTIKEQFMAGVLDDVSVYNRLGPLNLPTERVNEILEGWNALKLGRVAIPTKSEIEVWYKSGLLTGSELSQGYKNLRFTEADAGRFVRQLDIEIQTAAKDAADKAKTAADRQAASAVKNAQAQQRADLDVQIAQLKLHMSDCNVALHQSGLPAEEAASLRLEIVNTQDLIAELNVSKAKIAAGV